MMVIILTVNAKKTQESMIKMPSKASFLLLTPRVCGLEVHQNLGRNTARTADPK